ncbi:MAG: 1-(5-phosphoribosyl)-5-[(5-phosphoribosylamino)methylideneamino]imidazole-4-carboxamide isomerase [Dysgonamonadaceae bacterium]
MMRIIPAIDIINGKCVRLTKGDYNTQKTYDDNPLNVAKNFEDNGIKYLHLVDLDGAKSKHIVNYKILNEIATKTNLEIDFGGGIKSDEDIQIAFDNGARQITGGSIASQNSKMFLNWLSIYSADKIILGADSLNRKIATHGWQKHSETDVVKYIADYKSNGLKYTICTDISMDGMLQGPSTDLYIEILSKTNINLIASGGISSLNDLETLELIGCEGAIIGKAIYEGYISLKDLQNYILNNNRNA